MSGIIATRQPRAGRRHSDVSAEAPWVRVLLIATAALFLGVAVLLPLSVVFASAFSKGFEPFWAALWQPETISAMELTLLTAGIAVPLNAIFGIAAAWLVSRYDFWGKSALITLIDLPFSVSPVISGLIFVLLFGAQGLWGKFLSAHDIKIIFAVPGIVIATTFVTFPLVAREVLAVMQAQGSDEEEAALTMGASGFQILTRITLPKVRWGIIYGVILCNARAMGEFGAVSVVSGHIRGQTNTLPLHVEIMYNEYNFVGAFAVASLLASIALLTLMVKKTLELNVALRARRLARQADRERSSLAPPSSIRPSALAARPAAAPHPGH
ncbi:MAG TPA: sulfate ABC transporter permease subunit CysW [Polyangiaceae bacterium]|nr:sulfate ABC transporter permease subunit CysW [Polyangiaceae bacterium]